MFFVHFPNVLIAILCRFPFSPFFNTHSILVRFHKTLWLNAYLISYIQWFHGKKYCSRSTCELSCIIRIRIVIMVLRMGHFCVLTPSLLRSLSLQLNPLHTNMKRLLISSFSCAFFLLLLMLNLLFFSIVAHFACLVSFYKW